MRVWLLFSADLAINIMQMYYYPHPLELISIIHVMSTVLCVFVCVKRLKPWMPLNFDIQFSPFLSMFNTFGLIKQKLH